ncbi:MAG: lipoate--protein ligase [Lachnospiraceae bacterium]|nr:lipoate--protein ligase [Lachnospiraceae bacterium]
MALIYLETNSTDPFYNLAFEEIVLKTRTEGNVLILWQNDNTVVIGQNQITAAEINQAFIDRHHIRVVRRMTGGGAVYHDLGNLNFSFITDVSDSACSFRFFLEPVIQSLRSLGVPAELSGRNDILANGKKISGNAQRILHHRILHHGTLLFDSDFSMITGALQVDPEKFRSKAIRSVGSRVGNIREMLKTDMTTDAFWDFMKRSLLQTDMTEGALSDAELKAVSVLKAEKYDTREWNYGRSPHCDIHVKRYWDGGCLEADIALDKGNVSHISFYGDYLSRRPMDEPERSLTGVPFDRETFAKILRNYPLQEYFGSITEEEILLTIFS